MTRTLETIYPRGLLADATAYAHRRARQEHCPVYVYASGGIVYVRAHYEPAPDDSQLIYTTQQESAFGEGFR